MTFYYMLSISLFTSLTRSILFAVPLDLHKAFDSLNHVIFLQHLLPWMLVILHSTELFM